MYGLAERRRPTGLYLTLPLTRKFIENRAAAQQAVERSRSRWHWFVEGRRRNPALGTLSYLPIEIRCLIWKEIAGRHSWQDLVRNWPWSDWRFASHYYDTDLFIDSPPFIGHAGSRHLWLGNIRDTVKDIHEDLPMPYLRMALPLVGLEFDEMFLSTTTLEFCAWTSVMSTLNRYITPWQLPWLRHLSILLDSDAFGQVIFRENDLPPNLTKLTLDLAHENHLELYKKYQSVVRTKCRGESCRVGRYSGSTKPGASRSCKHINKSNFLANKLERDIELLETTTMVVVRNKPSVTIQLGNKNVQCRLCHSRCREILDSIKSDNGARIQYSGDNGK
ncbi:MAG: hypothetical protein LQ337_004940 [Flavoplaca oasis]|nr:MAG: hypothetical protein LQ337_004940 [Flavoplaca oasis]